MSTRTEATIEDLYHVPDNGKADDLQSEDVVRVYRANQPEMPTVYRRTEIAEAAPAVPGRKMPVDDLFA